MTEEKTRHAFSITHIVNILLAPPSSEAVSKAIGRLHCIAIKTCYIDTEPTQTCLVQIVHVIVWDFKAILVWYIKISMYGTRLMSRKGL